MLRSALTILLVACAGNEAPTTGPGTASEFPDLTTPSNADTVPLHMLPGTYTFGKSELSGDEADVYKLSAEEVPNPKKVNRKLKVVRAALPFTISSSQERFRPAGMTVHVNGKEVPYARGKAAEAETATWRVMGKHLVMSYPNIPAKGAIVVHFAGSANVLERHDLERSGKTPEEFVAYDITLKGETRHGLLLPAPASASWDVKIPANKPQFKAWLTLEKAVLAEPICDGANVALVVTADGVDTEVDVQPLEPGTPTYAPWTADLSAFAGKEVVVSLQTRPRETNHFDWVFLASPTITGAAKGPVKRVVVVAMDTTRPDHFGVNGYARGTTPEMDRVAGQSVVFTHAWSTAPRTRPSFRSSTTGRYPLKAIGAKNIGEVYQEKGFATAGIVANVHLQPRFDFDHGFDWWHYNGRHNADEQVDLALEWLQENSDRDTYLFLHFMDAHLPYRAPGDWKKKHVDEEDPTLPAQFGRWEVNKWSKKGDISGVRKGNIEGLHDGEMAFMTHHIGRFFDELDKLDGDTVAIVHSDHGEEFWEHGGFEHNHTLYDEVTRTVLWIRPGGGLEKGLRNPHPATVMDLAPTLYDLMGWSDVPETEGRSLAPLLDGADEANDWWSRPLPLAFVQYDKERWGVVLNSKKYILHTGSGWEELYHLKADPEEKKNLARNKTVNLQPWRDALAEAHGTPVRPGYRIRIALPAESAEITINLPATAIDAGVLDPEAAQSRRANLEWGETPKKTAAEVGKLEVGDDKRTLVFTPGSKPIGVIWVQFDEPANAAEVQLIRGGEPLAMEDGKAESRRWRENRNSVIVTPGWVLVPPPGEAALMHALAVKNGEELTADDDAMRLLKELGYIQQ